MRICLLLAVLAGCGGDQVLVSSDVRVDLADPGADPDSEGSRVCSVGEEVYAVWADARGGNAAVWLNASADGGLTWLSQPERISDGVGDASHPDIACTQDHVFVTWEDTRDGVLENKNVYLVRGFRGSAGNLRFDDPIALDDDEEGNAHSLHPRIAARGDGVWVTWSDQRNGAYDIYVATSDDAGEFFYAPRRLDSDAPGEAYSSLPQIAAARGGMVLVAWEDSRDGLSDIYAAWSDDGGLSFGDDFRLDVGDPAGSADSFSPQVAMDATGTAYVAWHDARNGEAGRDVYINWTSNGGASWAGEAVRVDSDNPGFHDSILPDVAVACGVGHLVWQDDRNGGYDVYYRRAIGGAFQDEERTLNGGGRGEANSVDPIVEAWGPCDTASDATLAVVWRDHRDDGGNQGYNDLYYAGSTDNGVTFSSLDLRLDALTPGSSYKVDVDIALVADQLRGVWVDGRSGSADVYFHGLTLGEQAELVPVDADEVEGSGGGDAGG
ncbi:MAG: exo-alpha-sialidase [Deltaproteobacteria bacterium]|nr:MAG: exo-alpha-sialidase [Deltaproteobacteria bacterium]